MTPYIHSGRNQRILKVQELKAQTTGLRKGTQTDQVFIFLIFLVFEYQNTKNSKGSNIESLKAQSSKRPSGVMQSLQPLSNRDIERSMTAINRNKSNEGSVKMLGSTTDTKFFRK